jgi:hypothetical protein
MVEVDVIGGCPSGVEADCLADYKGDCFCFRLANGLGCRGAALGLMQEFVCLCNAQHKPTYVVFAVMLCSGLVANGHGGLSPAYTT